jgi:hypothetical protein
MTIEVRDRDALFKHDGSRPADDDIEFLSPEDNRRFVDTVMRQAKGGRYSTTTPAQGYKMEDTGTTVSIGGRRLRVMRNAPGKSEEAEE